MARSRVLLYFRGMLAFDSRRRWFAYAGVALAAAASIATSAPSWSKEDSVGPIRTTLDGTSSEAVHHFTVHASQEPATGVIGHIRWDSLQTQSDAVVTVGVANDSGLSQTIEYRAR